jgi:hypothetical protein
MRASLLASQVSETVVVGAAAGSQGGIHEGPFVGRRFRVTNEVKEGGGRALQGSICTRRKRMVQLRCRR